ncbi:hypothetical protein EDD86DRAFT_216100 [Gorgonomyces haynaldii]|nr:hypothetical protein EDD86DRAFT_216100 [Gorgonomyces haynaldii]
MVCHVVVDCQTTMHLFLFICGSRSRRQQFKSQFKDFVHVKDAGSLVLCTDEHHDDDSCDTQNGSVALFFMFTVPKTIGKVHLIDFRGKSVGIEGNRGVFANKDHRLAEETFLLALHDTGYVTLQCEANNLYLSTLKDDFVPDDRSQVQGSPALSIKCKWSVHYDKGRELYAFKSVFHQSKGQDAFLSTHNPSDWNAAVLMKEPLKCEFFSVKPMGNPEEGFDWTGLLRLAIPVAHMIL